ncbi:transcription initiation factor TFIID subunit 7 [Folsomia candida]|uniref:transcription initiation factor TFIID subunit 7 n=1 Tax=Folsomia candida TaxID=158441 RepID=UPI000B8F29BB|nr:transcription initiation factor TFIID subunit 7 [Folsomia candida]
MSQYLSDGPSELESQFILRLPEAPASTLREALKIGNPNLKDRMKLKLNEDMRHGTLYFDHFVLPSKVVDLPCVLESHKSIDKKVVYKTADICQMLLCMEEEEPPEDESSKAVVPKKKDGVKVDKKFIWPHGITPPLKNVRKRRFRKTLKKKQYLDQPEIEKEVRRLLRTDYEAHHVSWEVIDEEEDKTKEGGVKDVLMQGSKTNEPSTDADNSRVGAAELFGDALSDSDGDDEDLLDRGDVDEDNSRISVEEDSSRLSDSQSMSYQNQDMPSSSKKSSYVTSFSKDMFLTPSGPSSHGRTSKSPDKKSKQQQRRRTSSAEQKTSLTKAEMELQLADLKMQLTEISGRRSIQEMEVATTDNAALKSRLETVLNKLVMDQTEKEREIREVEMFISQSHF